MKRRWPPFVTGLVVAVAVFVGVPAIALAAFSALGSGSAPTSAAAFPAPGKPTVTAGSGGQVSVAWTATTLSTGKAVDSYQVRRTIGTTVTTVCTTTSLTCTDTPGAAASYQVVAKLAGWTSTSAATTYTPDTTAPTITDLRLSADDGSSSTDFVTSAATQTLSGKTEAGAAVRVTYRGSTYDTTANGNGAFSISLTLQVGSFDIVVRSTDAAGNATSLTQPVTLTPASTPANAAVVPGNTATAMQSISWQIPSNANSTFCFTATITGTSTTPQAWSLLVHLDEPPFYSAAANQLYYQGNSQVQIAGVGGDSTLARITGVGGGGGNWNASWNNALLDSTRTLTVTVCDSQPQVPTLGDPSWYTAKQTQGTRNANTACVDLTITAKTVAADNPFFFGWQGSVDLTAAKQYVVDKGKTINYVGWSPDPSSGFQFSTSPSTYNPVANTYTLSSGKLGAVKAGQSTTVTACVYGY